MALKWPRWTKWWSLTRRAAELTESHGKTVEGVQRGWADSLYGRANREWLESMRGLDLDKDSVRVRLHSDPLDPELALDGDPDVPLYDAADVVWDRASYTHAGEWMRVAYGLRPRHSITVNGSEVGVPEAIEVEGKDRP